METRRGEVREDEPTTRRPDGPTTRLPGILVYMGKLSTSGKPGTKMLLAWKTYLDEREANIGDPAVHDVRHTRPLHRAQTLPQVLCTGVGVAVPLHIPPARRIDYTSTPVYCILIIGM
jgi:hypothetical protein